MTALSVEHGWHAPTGILTWYKLVWLHLPCLAQTAVLVRVNGSCIGQVIISLFLSIFSLLQECFLVISVWCLKKKPSFPRPYITSDVHVITRSLKEYTGFTEIPGRLRTAHLLGQMTLFLKAPMVLPHVCHHECQQHLPWYRLDNVVPLDILLLAMEGHLSRQVASRPDRHSSAVWEPCYTFLPSITPETYLVAVTLDSTQISLNPAHLNPPGMGNDLQRHWGL